MSNNPFVGQTVAVLGDLVLDRFIYGDAHRLSTEAPIPVVQAKRRTQDIGCAGTVAHSLAALQANPLLIGQVGSDADGQAFTALCEEYAIHTDYLVTIDQPMTTKTRLIANGQQVARFDEEVSSHLAAEARQKLLGKVKAAREQTDILILSDYGYHTIDEEMVAAVLDIWGQGTVLTDPQALHRIDYAGVHGLVPTMHEAQQLLRAPVDVGATDADAAGIAQRLMSKYNLNYVLLVRQEAGLTFAAHGGEVEHLPVRERKRYDTTSVVDIILAAFAAGLAGKMLPQDAARLANVAASIALGRPGKAMVTWEEIAKDLGVQ